MPNMKQLLVILCFLPFSPFAQMNEVSGGNIGLNLSAGSLLMKPSGGGFEQRLGVTSSLAEVIFGDVSIASSQERYTFDSLPDFTNNVLKLGLSINNKIPIYSLKLGKSNRGECWYFNFKFLLDYKFDKILRTSTNFSNSNQHGLNLGLGLRPSYSGGHKSRVAWSFFYDVFYHMDLNNSINPAISSENYRQNGVYFRLTVLHHKTYDFLDQGINKKKAYKRKM